MYVMIIWGSDTLFSDARKRDRIHKFYPLSFFVYTVQILFAFYSGVVFLRSCGMTKKVWLVWGSLGLLTCPFALQCHVAVLPNSLGFSFLLLELSVLMGILRQDADGDPVKFPLRQMFTAGVWWALGTVFVVENLWLGLVPLAVVWVLHLIRGRQLGNRECWENWCCWRQSRGFYSRRYLCGRRPAVMVRRRIR